MSKIYGLLWRGGCLIDNLKAEAILYINQMLSDQYSLVEERRLDPDYVHDQDLQEMTEHELAEILNAQKFMEEF